MQSNYWHERWVKNRESLSAQAAIYYRKNRAPIIAYSRKRHWRLKVEVLRHYSKTSYPSCVRCGEVDIRCLSLDHINGEGAAERRKHGSISQLRLYPRLKKEAFPPGFQTLCMNCQYRKRMENHEFNFYARQFRSR